MKTITVFKGDGIGPEITDAVLQILDAAKAPLSYEIFNVGAAEYERHGALIPDDAFASFEKTHLLLKSPITTPIGKGFHSSTSRCATNTTSMPISVRPNRIRPSRRLSPTSISLLSGKTQKICTSASNTR